MNPPDPVDLASVFSRECILTMPPYVTEEAMIKEVVSFLAKAGSIPQRARRRLVSLSLEEPMQLMPADEQAALLRVFTTEVNVCVGAIALTPQGIMSPNAPATVRLVFVMFCPLQRHAEASLVTDHLARLTSNRAFPEIVSFVQNGAADSIERRKR